MDGKMKDLEIFIKRELGLFKGEVQMLTDMLKDASNEAERKTILNRAAERQSLIQFGENILKEMKRIENKNK